MANKFNKNTVRSMYHLSNVPTIMDAETWNTYCDT